jgi:hypothetical protein
MNLIDEYRRLAADGGNFHGLSILNHSRIIGKLAYRTGAQTFLDYGCGRGDAWRPPYSMHEKIGIAMPTLYDPSFPTHDKKPSGMFGGVLCSDVLEHVPEDDVTPMIEELFGYARCFVWGSVCCRPAKKKFDDGTNMHVTIKPIEWWREKFGNAAAIRNARDPLQVTWYLTQTP